MCFATNFFVARRDWFTSERYLSFFRHVSRSMGRTPD